jgi:hypothetical protein
MRKYLFISIAAAGLAFSAGCGSQPAANTGNSNANNVVNLNNANLPEGFSTTPIQPGPGQTPGIPAENTTKTVPSNVSPAEGIPSADDLKKPFKPGPTPTPGIPSPEELKRMRNTSNGNANTKP